MNIQPRKGSFMGMPVLPVILKDTWVEGEMMNTDYGQFKRMGLVYHSQTQQLVKVRCDVPDTYFSIPATTATEYGFVTTNNAGVFQFVPMKEQKMSPAAYRQSVKRAYK